MPTLSANIKWATNLDELRQQLKSGTDQLVVLQSAAERTVRSLGGEGLIRAAHNAAAAVQELGGSTKLTRSEQDRVNSLMDRAIEKYRALGQQAPSALLQLRDATQKVAGETSSLDDHLKQIASRVQQFSGSKLIQEAHQITTAVQQIGGATKLTDQEMSDINAKMTAVIAKMKALGQTAPESFLALEAATSRANVTVEQLPANLQKVSTNAKTAEGTLEGLTGTLKTVAGAFGIAFSIQQVVDFGKSLMDLGDHIVKVADQTGLTTDEVQKLDFIAGQSGNTIDDLTGAIGQMQKRLSSGDQSAVAALKQLHLSFEDLKNLDPYDQMIAIADAIQKIPNPANQAQIAMELFGKTGISILPTIKAGMRDLANEAPVMSDATVRALDRAGDEFNKFKREVQVFAADSYLYLRGFFDKSVALFFDLTSKIYSFWATLMEGVAKLPGATTIVGSLATTIKDLKDQSQFFADAAKAQNLQINAIDPAAKKATAPMLLLRDATKDVGAASHDLTQQSPEYQHALELMALANKHLAEEAKLAAQQQAANFKAFGDFAAHVPTAIFETRNLTAVVPRIDTSAIPTAASEVAAATFNDIEGRMDKLGVHTRATLQQMAADAKEQYESMRDSGLYTDQELEAAWERMTDAQIASVGRIKGVFLGFLRQLPDELSRAFNLESLFGVGFDPDGELRKAADAAKQNFHDVQMSAQADFDKIAHSGTATADEIAQAHQEMADKIKAAGDQWRDAENRANYTFGERMKDVWKSIERSILSVFDDILAAFEQSLLRGMLGALMGQRGAFANAFAGLFGGGGGLGTAGIGVGGIGTGGTAGGGTSAGAAGAGAGLAAIGAGVFGAGLLGGKVAGRGGAITGSVAAGTGGAALLGTGTLTAGTIGGAVALGAATFGIGAAAVGAFALVKHIMSTAGRDAVQAFVDQNFGGWDNFHKRLNDMRDSLKAAGYDSEELWKEISQGVSRGDAKEAAAAIQHVTDALNQAAQIQARTDLGEAAQKAIADWQELEKTGTATAEDLDAAWQKVHDAVAATGDLDLAAKFDEADKSVQGLKATIGKLDDQIAGLQQSVDQEAPEAVMGTLEKKQRAQLELLKKQRADAQKQFDELAQHIGDSISDAIHDALKGPFSLQVNGHVSVETPETGTGSGTGGEGRSGEAPEPSYASTGGLIAQTGRVVQFQAMPVQHYAGGGIARVLDFTPRGPDVVPAMLARGEGVFTPNNMAAMSSNLAYGIDELSRMVSGIGHADLSDLGMAAGAEASSVIGSSRSEVVLKVNQRELGRASVPVLPGQARRLGVRVLR